MAYRSIAFIPTGERQSDGVPLHQLCRGLVEDVCGVHLLYVGVHHVTGFGSMTARNLIANDMQIKQEIYPVLKELCGEENIPASNIHICFGDAADCIESFVADYEVDLLALGANSRGVTSRQLKLLTGILNSSDCDLLVIR